MYKEQIIERIEQFDCDNLMEMLNLYIKHLEIKKCKYTDTEEELFILPEHIKESIKFTRPGSEGGVWAETVKRLPKKFSRPNLKGKQLLEHAYKTWSGTICGLEDVYSALIPHLVEYSNTFHTSPVLLVGEPGCGKSTVARLYSEMFGLPHYFINAPRCVRGRGLSGETRAYQGAGAGEIVDGILKTQIANPVFVIDEIDKVKTYAGHGGEFPNELLSLLDNCGVSEFKDNYLQFTLNLIHSPFVLTANYIDDISAPLRDRCDIITFAQNTKEAILNILEKNTIPNELKKYDNNVVIEQPIIQKLVNVLYDKGLTSLRPYQAAISKLINMGIIESINDTQTWSITDEQLNKVLAQFNTNNPNNRIGFIV